LGLSQSDHVRQNPSALAGKMTQSKQWQGIPTSLTVQQFDEFVLQLVAGFLTDANFAFPNENDGF
jgi:hypothetical protein